MAAMLAGRAVAGGATATATEPRAGGPPRPGADRASSAATPSAAGDGRERLPAAGAAGLRRGVRRRLRRGHHGATATAVGILVLGDGDAGVVLSPQDGGDICLMLAYGEELADDLPGGAARLEGASARGAAARRGRAAGRRRAARRAGRGVVRRGTRDVRRPTGPGRAVPGCWPSAASSSCPARTSAPASASGAARCWRSAASRTATSAARTPVGCGRCTLARRRFSCCRAACTASRCSTGRTGRRSARQSTSSSPSVLG